MSATGISFMVKSENKSKTSDHNLSHISEYYNTPPHTHQSPPLTNANMFSIEIKLNSITNWQMKKNPGRIRHSTARSIFQILQIFKHSQKNIPFEQYLRLHLKNIPLAICETVSNEAFVFDSSLTQ